jgi:quercetin dioxygenase-like cupin family protein
MGRSGSVWAMVAVLVVAVGLVPVVVRASDADPLQDFCVADPTNKVVVNGFPCKPFAQATAWDFTSQALVNAGNTNNPNLSNVTMAFVQQFAGLNTLGIGAARIDFAKGGINPPHTHPRASEIVFVLKGELYVGFVDTQNMLFATTIKQGELFVFPRGLVHFQLNVGNGPALLFAALNSQNPGAQAIAQSLFGSTPPVSDEVLEKGFRISQQTVDAIRQKFPQ